MIIQTHQRPENIESLRTPKLNTALQILDVGAKRRDRYFGLLQEPVGCTLKIVSNLMSEVKRGKMDRRKMYAQLSDATCLLRASHKDISQHRRESLRPALNKDYRVICTAQQNAKLTSNEFLFGEDLSKRADEALKALAWLTNLLVLMWQKREQQGLRLPEPDLYTVPEQEEWIPTVPEPMAICIPKLVQWRQE